MTNKGKLKFRIGSFLIWLTSKEFGIWVNLIKFEPHIGYICRLCNGRFKTGRGAHIHLDKKHSEFIVKDLLRK